MATVTAVAPTSIGKYFRERIVTQIQKRYEQTRQVIFVEFDKVDAFTMNKFRNTLREKNASMVVSKTTLIEKAFSQSQTAGINLQNVTGATGMIFLENDPVDACKIVADFAKEKESFKIKGAIIDAQSLTDQQVKELAKLPSHQVLRGMCVNILATPLTNLVSTLNNIIVQCVLVIQAVQEKKEKEKA